MHLVFGRRFHVVDHHHLDRSFRGNKLQPELLLERGVKVGAGVAIVADSRCIARTVALRFVRRPFQVEVISTVQAGLIHNRLIQKRPLHVLGNLSSQTFRAVRTAWQV